MSSPSAELLIYRNTKEDEVVVGARDQPLQLPQPVLVRSRAPWDCPEASQNEHTLLPQAEKQRQEGNRHVAF